MKRRVRFIMFCLLAGGIVNIVVALYFFHRDPIGLSTIGSGQCLIIVMHGSRGWSAGSYERIGTTHLSALVKFDPLTILKEFYDEPPYWSSTRTMAPPEIHAFMDEAAYGYPFRTLKIMHYYTGSGDDVRDGVPIVEGLATQRLPTDVIWPGFLLNSILYAAVFLAPFMFIAGSRLLSRRLRGQCSNCGYDLRGIDHDACPECGKPLLQPDVYSDEIAARAQQSRAVSARSTSGGSEAHHRAKRRGAFARRSPR